MLHAVIMAGGAGTRFWPASRAATPKQLLNLSGSRTMIQMTVDRLGQAVPADRVLVVTNQRLVAGIQEQLPELPPTAIVGEPCKRDTAPCIGLAALAVRRTDPDATLAVMPSDHVIGTAESFQQAIQFAAGLVDEAPQRIVTFGIPPTYPAESFGYIQRGAQVAAADDSTQVAYQVEQFREKPDEATARDYLAAGGYYWNAGIFVWKAETILAALRTYQPQLYERLERIADVWGTNQFDDVLAREFTAIEGISIDYAVMEHADDVVVVEAQYDWDDVGSWQALARLHGTDDQGNTAIGKHLGVDTQGTIVRTDDDHLVVTLGLEDCIVVHTPDATLVAHKHQEEAIRQVVRQLESRDWREYL